jgi:hypothetical protein
MAMQIVMDPTGDTRHEFNTGALRPWRKLSGASGN